MKLSDFSHAQRPHIQTHLDALVRFERHYQGLGKMGRDTTRHYQELLGGKMLRGLLVLIGYGLYKPRFTKDAYQLAAILELLHLTLLIHDDIMDNDTLRRGKPSLHASYAREAAKKSKDPKHAGMSLALCAGDIGIFHAMRALGSLHTTRAIPTLLDILGSRMTLTGFGQMADFALGDNLLKPTKKQITQTLMAKTAHYTGSLPLEMGAVLADASLKERKQLGAIGEELGYLFQVRDDEIGLFGTTAKIGKKVGSDIREGKHTLFTLYLTEKATSQERKKLKGIMGNPKVTASEIAYVRELITSYGIDTRIHTEMEKRATKLLSAIANLDGKKGYKSLLQEIVGFCLTRTV